MTLPIAATFRSITATSRLNLDSQIDQAVQALLGPATEQKCGMLVTRDSLDGFTVRLSYSLPFGSVHERDEWAR
ncbi:hypothetical protein [Arthrobacter sp. M4]|uniref:hypothetical protein n=1 Tax=Arthrobacter sp. M4 TaxID=218160 RepID=UPI001CDCD6A9|nr:hypothetical protein [Arthrobacter sp. M4]MCA4132528.1 hypothetical protein [Arthrobacter sp. M4]